MCWKWCRHGGVFASCLCVCKHAYARMRPLDAACSRGSPAGHCAQCCSSVHAIKFAAAEAAASSIWSNWRCPAMLPAHLLKCMLISSYPCVLPSPQEEREALFVPSGWHHTVVNEADTLSINHNWLNAHNVHRSWALLAAEHAAATAALEDCRCVGCNNQTVAVVSAYGHRILCYSHSCTPPHNTHTHMFPPGRGFCTQ